MARGKCMLCGVIEVVNGNCPNCGVRIKNFAVPRPSWQPKSWGSSFVHKKQRPHLVPIIRKNGAYTGLIHGISPRK